MPANERHSSHATTLSGLSFLLLFRAEAQPDILASLPLNAFPVKGHI
jgi:hypothetical protein